MPHYIVRHAATVLNEQDRMRAGTDAPLSEAGRAQVERVAGFFKDKPISQVHTSDTRRATDTANAIAKAGHASVVIDKGLRPWNVPGLAGKPTKGTAPILAHLYANHRLHHASGGESFADFFSRFLSATKPILQSAGSHVLVTHGRNVKTLHELLRGRGRLMKDAAPHDPTPTEPGDVYEVHPDGLRKVFSVPQEGTTTHAKASS